MQTFTSISSNTLNTPPPQNIQKRAATNNIHIQLTHTHLDTIQHIYTMTTSSMWTCTLLATYSQTYFCIYSHNQLLHSHTTSTICDRLRFANIYILSNITTFSIYTQIHSYFDTTDSMFAAYAQLP